MRHTSGTGWNHISGSQGRDNFSEKLSLEDRIEFESIRSFSDYPAEATLFVEQQVLDNVLFLMTGQVKLSLNSRAGKRIILGVACPGETLGLASAFSKSTYDVTAETVAPCTIASIATGDFLGFLIRHPSVYINVVRELCLEYARACGQVRRLGLSVTASAKLVRFLLEQCAVTPPTQRGSRLFCALTHTEIGECLGISRETVTRLLSDFRSRELLESRGSTWIISDRRALEAYAGIE